MTDGPYLLGIDFGTGGARVGIFDPEGTPLVSSEREYSLEHPRPGWAEQDPDEWWSCLVAAVKESSISPEAIAGISIDAMSSTVLAMDENDRHLRPAIMWMDVRSSEQADRIAGTNNKALKFNGYGVVSAEWGVLLRPRRRRLPREPLRCGRCRRSAGEVPWRCSRSGLRDRHPRGVRG